MTESSDIYLPNPVYTALSTAQAKFSLAHGLAWRFQPDTIPFAAVPEPSSGAMRDLSEMLSPGEEIWTTLEEDQTLPAIPGLELVSTLVSLQMRYVDKQTAEGRRGCGPTHRGGRRVDAVSETACVPRLFRTARTRTGQLFRHSRRFDWGTRSDGRRTAFHP